jgi:large subunit ribosomal protein L6
MHLEHIQETVDLQEGADVAVNGFIITVKGPKGELSHRVGHKKLKMSIADGVLKFEATNATRKEKRAMRTSAAHVRNMMRGVTEGHTYKLKICSGHFPMNVSLKGNMFEVKNFIGEAVPRQLEIKEGITVKVDGQDIIVEGADKARTGNQAAAIEQLTKRPGFDTRIFQDGIYIVEKDGKEV